MIHTALEAAINFVDTADVYSRGESEEIVGQALRGRRDGVVLATKFGLPTAQRYGLGVLTYGPLSSGWLSGRPDPAHGHRARTAPGMFDLAIPANQARQTAVQRLTALAAEAGLPLTHLATAFARSHPAVTSVLIGPRQPEQLAPADNYLAAHPATADKKLRRRVH